jgi:branched-subunit amino acid ABC-type transport system permease component
VSFAFSVLAQSAVLILVTLGLHVTFGMLGLVNLAHAAQLMIGGYTAYAVMDATGSYPLALVAAVGVAAVTAVPIEVLIIRRLYDRPVDSLVATFGLTILVRQAIHLIFSADPRGLDNPIPGSTRLLGVIVPYWSATLIVAAIALTVGIYVWFVRSPSGLRARCAVSNDVLASTNGVDVGLTRLWLFAAGAGLAGLGGALVAPLYTLDPTFGLSFLVYAFFIVMLGGIGSLAGLWPAAITVSLLIVGLQYVVSAITAQVLAFALIVVAIRFRGSFMRAGARLWRIGREATRGRLDTTQREDGRLGMEVD